MGGNIIYRVHGQNDEHKSSRSLICSKVVLKVSGERRARKYECIELIRLMETQSLRIENILRNLLIVNSFSN